MVHNRCEAVQVIPGVASGGNEFGKSDVPPIYDNVMELVVFGKQAAEIVPRLTVPFH
jgi:hypothetical protein